LFVHRNKAAASCRTPSASRLPTPTASAAAREKTIGISGEIEWGHMGTDTLLAWNSADGPLAQA